MRGVLWTQRPLLQGVTSAGPVGFLCTLPTATLLRVPAVHQQPQLLIILSLPLHTCVHRVFWNMQKLFLTAGDQAAGKDEREDGLLSAYTFLVLYLVHLFL